MRTIDDIAKATTRLFGRKIAVSIDSDLKEYDATYSLRHCNIHIHPVYLDKSLVSDKNLEAMLLHELGHAADAWPYVYLMIFILCMGILLLSLILEAFSICSVSPFWVAMLILVAGGILVFHLFRVERVADSSALGRMPDFYAYKYCDAEPKPSEFTRFIINGEPSLERERIIRDQLHKVTSTLVSSITSLRNRKQSNASK
jgi:hypothetical protein